MHTQCNSAQLTLEGLGRREVIGKFGGGRMSSDGGSVLLRAANRVLDLTARMARCFSDNRDERRSEHSVEALVGQRVYGLALGYEDLNFWNDRTREADFLLRRAGTIHLADAKWTEPPAPETPNLCARWLARFRTAPCDRCPSSAGPRTPIQSAPAT